MEELKNSIMEYGLIQPVTVRRRSGEYELVAGERRFRAAQMAGLDEIPAVIIEADNDKSAILALLENLQREDLSFFEIAENYKSLTGTYTNGVGFESRKKSSIGCKQNTIIKTTSACEKINKRLRPYGTSREGFAVA